MTWSSEQDAALLGIPKLIESGQKVVRLFGYAGTGKTTLAKELAQLVGGSVKFAAYTGKAASVLRKKGCGDVSTIHQLIYRVSQPSTANLEVLIRDLKALMENGQMGEAGRVQQEIAVEEKRLKTPSFWKNQDADLSALRMIIIDECSMVDETIGADLESFGVPILVLGDPAQLPPVRGGGYFTDAKPDFLLTQIHRQALHSGILRLATDIRMGRGYKVGSYGDDCRVVRMGQDGNTERAMVADQVLVGRNFTRRKVNRTLRNAKGRREALPMLGDKLVCLRNDHRRGLLNGTLWEVTNPGVRAGNVVVGVNIIPLDVGAAQTVDMHARTFLGEDIPGREYKDAREFDFAEALTVHKAQGSQWNRVYMFDETGPWGAENHWRHLYTGVTRAAEEHTLVERS